MVTIWLSHRPGQSMVMAQISYGSGRADERAMRRIEELRSCKPRRARTQKGSALMESAFVFTAFMVIIFGIMDWGRMMLANNFVSYAAREGARYAIVHGSSSPHPAQASDVT